MLKGVTKTSNAVTSNAVTRKRVAGKFFQVLKNRKRVTGKQLKGKNKKKRVTVKIKRVKITLNNNNYLGNVLNCNKTNNVT